MSYILDALRKADAQRQRDPARGIHAQPLRASMKDDRPGAAYPPWVWFAASAGVVLLATAGWYLSRSDDRPGQDRSVVVVAQGAAPRVSAPPPAVVTLPPPAAEVLPAPAPVPAPAATLQRPPAAPRVRPASAAIMEAPRGMVSARAAQMAPPTQPTLGVPPPAPSIAAAVPSAAPPIVPPGIPPAPAAGAMAAPGPGMNPAIPPIRPSAPVTPAAPAAAGPAPPTLPVTGLPPDAPKLTITGGVYSTSRAQRMLIVNGQVYREGADLGSGVTLQEIRPRTVELLFRGGRYSAPMP